MENQYLQCFICIHCLWYLTCHFIKMVANIKGLEVVTSIFIVYKANFVWKITTIISAWMFVKSTNTWTRSQYFSLFKGALDKCNIIPNFFQKKLRFLSSINTQYSSLWDTLEMMLFTKYLIKWKRIGRISWNFRYWFNSKSSIEKDRCYTCPMPL